MVAVTSSIVPDRHDLKRAEQKGRDYPAPASAFFNPLSSDAFTGAPRLITIMAVATMPIKLDGLRFHTTCTRLPDGSPGEMCASTKLPGLQKLLSSTSQRTTPGFDQSYRSRAHTLCDLLPSRTSAVLSPTERTLYAPSHRPVQTCGRRSEKSVSSAVTCSGDS